MKTSLNLGFDISAKGMSIERRKMNVIAENIANADTTRTSEGGPYKKKFLEVIQNESLTSNIPNMEGNQLRLNISEPGHIPMQVNSSSNVNPDFSEGLTFKEGTDNKAGELVYMPEHPDADAKGYVQMSNVSVINEMVDMIAASRGFEANTTAFAATKQIAKDSLDI